MNYKLKYKGVVVPMITPLDEDFSIDRNSVVRIVQSFLDAGASPFIAGTTGESASLSLNQKETLLQEVVRLVSGQTLVYAGISSTCITDSTEMAKRFSGLGADVLVANLPSYYPVNNGDMFRYCEQLANECPKPLILYNIPSTTGFSVPLDTIERLSHHPNIVGIKDSERDVDRLRKSLELWKDRDDFAHLTGWAAMSSFALQSGSDGIVPSTANFAPHIYCELYKTAVAGESEKAEKLQQTADALSTLYQKNRTLSGSLAALKVIMSVKGLCGSQMMPPIYKMNKDEELRYGDEIREELNKLMS